MLFGQILIFDLLAMQKIDKRMIKCDSVTKTAEMCTSSVKSYTFEMKKLTEKQQKILE